MHQRFAPALASAVVVVGASVFATAQMGPNDDRRLPYQGYIENGGSPAATGEYQIRFGLFATANADAACLATDPANCSLWGEEQTTTVTEGRFSVVLGDSNPLDNDVINQTALFLGIAVNGPDDSVFTVLGSKQELLAVPFAARAAQAQDYNVVGALSADSVTAGSGDFSTTTSDTVDATTASIDTVRVRTNGADVQINANGAANGVALQALTNPAAGGAIFSVLSEGGSERLRVEHDGAVRTTNDLSVDGNASVQGAFTHGCPDDWARVGEHCIENVLRGGAGANWEQATVACHDQGSFLCPVRALAACDHVEPFGAQCTATTDVNQWLLTSDMVGNDTNIFDGVVIFNHTGNNATNEIDATNSEQATFSGAPIRYFCCRHSGGL